MENGRDRVSGTRVNAARAAAHSNLIAPTSRMHRSMMNWEDHAVTLLKRYNLGARPHRRALLGEYDRSIREVNVRPRKEERDRKARQAPGFRPIRACVGHNDALWVDALISLFEIVVCSVLARVAPRSLFANSPAARHPNSIAGRSAEAMVGRRANGRHPISGPPLARGLEEPEARSLAGQPRFRLAMSAKRVSIDQ
jgi:hypothetical protein